MCSLGLAPPESVCYLYIEHSRFNSYLLLKSRENENKSNKNLALYT